ncbi:MAG: cytosine deaminase [Fusobacterium perfoetens]|uniref:cytosine deaminase n=1 Tax=Fusobacterium perfoetens TaxID=852 RepID=UPI0023F398DD|nr:cytosine deaminase [Fusobacterium perfoetens]MCI6153443.1 cytosine deaminase [Fusobacterium perfoetens]MDY3238414.1 cytosine deaminase [Fusobacterium perfoetens]
MLIKNIFIENSKEASDIRIENGIFKTIGKNLSPLPDEEVLDCTGKSAFPPFIESHVHLDTCLTAGDPVWNMSGTLFEGIECWSKRKEKLSKEDVKDRARRAIKMQVANGVQHIRTHVDVTDPTLIAMQGMIELREELKDIVNIQIVAFPQEGILSYPNGKELLENAVKMGADCVGAIPHFEFTREYAVESINYCIDLALKYNKLVDVHCDEIDDEQSKGLEVLACRALESGLKNKVTASHTTAMHSYNNAYCSKLFRLLGMSDINFVCNPLVNTHLQGRFDTYPKRRGVTRVKELLANGNNVSFGHDDIFDPWYPLGTGNMMTVAHMGLHVCQMMGYEEIMNSYKLITYNAAKTLNLGDSYGIKEGNPASFLIINSDNFYNALNNQSEILYHFNKGKVIASTKPAVKEIFF